MRSSSLSRPTPDSSDRSLSLRDRSRLMTETQTLSRDQRVTARPIPPLPPPRPIPPLPPPRPSPQGRRPAHRDGNRAAAILRRQSQTCRGAVRLIALGRFLSRRRAVPFCGADPLLRAASKGLIGKPVPARPGAARHSDAGVDSAASSRRPPSAAIGNIRITKADGVA